MAWTEAARRSAEARASVQGPAPGLPPRERADTGPLTEARPVLIVTAAVVWVEVLICFVATVLEPVTALEIASGVVAGAVICALCSVQAHRAGPAMSHPAAPEPGRALEPSRRAALRAAGFWILVSFGGLNGVLLGNAGGLRAPLTGMFAGVALGLSIQLVALVGAERRLGGRLLFWRPAGLGEPVSKKTAYYVRADPVRDVRGAGSDARTAPVA